MLKFRIYNQTIKREDRFNPATDSVDYLQASFEFLTPDWDGYSKTALFRLGTKTYEAVLDKDNICKVPHEVLVASDKNTMQLAGVNKIFVSVVGLKGASRITTNEQRVELAASGYTEGETPAEPTPDAYAQYVEQVRELVESVNTPDQKYNPESEAGQSGKAVAEGIALHNEDENAHADIREALSNRANALKANASGEVVRVDDVSPNEHTARAKVRGKNLLSYPYYPFTTEKVGVTITANEDGSITLNGTSTASWNVGFFGSELATPTLSKGTYTFSLKNGDANKCYLVVGGNSSKVDYTFGTEITFTMQEEGVVGYCLMQIVSGATFDNLTVYPQLEAGDTATEYEPYIDPTSVKVTRCGKNLFPYPFNATMYDNGITFTDNGDGSVTLNGTNNGESNSVFYITKDTYIRLPKGKYTGASLASGVSVMGVETGGGYLTLNQAFELSKDTTLRSIYVQVLKGNTTTFNNVTVYPMLEFGAVKSGFEKYNGMTYTPNADGTLEIPSLAPTMTVLTDTTGVNIELEYNQDSNKALANVKADIKELDRVQAEHTALLGDVETALDNIISMQNSLIGGDVE